MKTQLESRGYSVWAPLLPHAEEPRIQEWLPFALENGTYTEETVLIGHSSGCPLILSILENLQVRVRQAVMVAAFFEQLGPDGQEPILQDSYNWQKITEHVSDLLFINSDNDPWGCDVEAGQKLLKNTGGTLVIPNGQGHMGSLSFNQPYKEFPLLCKLIC